MKKTVVFLTVAAGLLYLHFFQYPITEEGAGEGQELENIKKITASFKLKQSRSKEEMARSLNFEPIQASFQEKLRVHLAQRQLLQGKMEDVLKTVGYLQARAESSLKSPSIEASIVDEVRYRDSLVVLIGLLQEIRAVQERICDEYRQYASVLEAVIIRTRSDLKRE
jgi:hypothetical protein